MNSVPKMNKSNLANQKFVYNVYFIHFSVGRVSNKQAHLKKSSKVSIRSKVRGFDQFDGYRSASTSVEIERKGDI
jgi:hypothetical protein